MFTTGFISRTGQRDIALFYNGQMHAGENMERLLKKQFSKPIMIELHEYITDKLALKQVEPNDSVGKAMRYMLKHWHELTQFIRVKGAPLDNNIG
jgi:transposase